MPSHASANPEIKQLYINGHFCYAFKFGIITNGLGIVRHIAFYNKDFTASHPDITIGKKSDSPDEDKSVHDSRLLIPTLKDFFLKHPLINPKTFLGDAAFDTAALYPKLLTGNTFGDNKHFHKAYIPLNSRAGLEKQDYTLNENGIPCCPHDDSFPMKYQNSEAVLPDTSLSVLKSSGPKMNLLASTCGTAHAMIHVQLPLAAEWCIFILKRIFVPIPELFVVPKNGITLTKSEPP